MYNKSSALTLKKAKSQLRHWRMYPIYIYYFYMIVCMLLYYKNVIDACNSLFRGLAVSSRLGHYIIYIVNRDPVKILYYIHNILGTRVHDAYTLYNITTIQIRRREQRVFVVTKLDIIWRRTVPYAQTPFARREI